MITNIIKGFIVGVLKIVPGVSGSMMAICLGVYERLIGIIAHLTKMTLKDFIFLITFVLGVILGICFFSDILKHLLKNYYFIVMMLFLGLIIGSMQIYLKGLNTELKHLKTNNYLTVFISFILSLLLLIICNTLKIDADGDIILYITLGIIEVATSIIPGISGTAIFTSMGCYNMIIDFFSDIFNPTYRLFGICFIIGIILGLIIVSKLIKYLFDKHKLTTDLIIIGLMLSSIVVMIYTIFKTNFTLLLLVLGIILLIIGYFLAIYVDKLLVRKED